MNRNLGVWTILFLFSSTLPFGQASGKAGESANTTVIKTGEAKEEVLDNDSIIEMIKIGLPEQIILSKIQTTKSNFNLTVEELGRLNKAGVSPKVLEIMMSKENPPPSAPGKVGDQSEPTDGSPRPATGDENDPNTSREAGIYLQTEIDGKKEMIVLEQAGYQGSKTGGTVTSSLTLGIKKAKIKAVVPGTRASIRTADKIPVFYFYFESGASNFGKVSDNWFGAQDIKNPNQFALIKLKVTGKSRETIIAEAGAFGASTGTHEKSMVTFKSQRIRPGVYKVIPLAPLEPGEYCFLASSSQMGAAGTMGSPYAGAGSLFIYDFAVTSGE